MSESFKLALRLIAALYKKQHRCLQYFHFVTTTVNNLPRSELPLYLKLKTL